MRTNRPVRSLWPPFRHDRSGSAVVEFALIVSLLLTLTAVAIDFTSISNINREIERTGTQVAATVVACPQAVAGSVDSCVTDTMRQYIDRKVNMLLRYPDMNISIIQINEVSGSIKVCIGNGTYLEDDVKARALAVMDDQDMAIVVVMSMTYQPIFPYVTRVFTGTTTSTLRGFTVAVRAAKSQCVKESA